MNSEQRLSKERIQLIKLSNNPTMKSSYYIACFLIILSSCTFEEKDIFNASPAERINKSIIDNVKTLTDAENGWVMEYFANKESGGYNLLVKFNKSGLATFAAFNELTKNGEFEKDSCLFEIIGDNGPVLTFNTFNKILHKFSNPENPDGYGLQGDYEFIIVKTEVDKITLKGKKYASIIILKKMPVETNWNKYLIDLDALTKQLFSVSSPKLTLKIDKSTYIFYYVSSQVFQVKKEGLASFKLNVPFIIRPNGIRFQELLEFDGYKFQNFTIDTEKSAFISVENKNYKIMGVEDLALYFVNYPKIWEIDMANSSPQFKSFYDEIVLGIKNNYNAENVKLSIKYYEIRRNFVLSISFMQGSNFNEGNIDLAVNSTNSDVLLFSNKNTADVNGTKYYNEVKGIKEFTNLLSSSFSLSSICRINPRTIKLAKMQDSNTWLTIKDN